MKLYDTIGDTIDNVTHWIFVGEVYARQYSTISKKFPICAGGSRTETNNAEYPDEKHIENNEENANHNFKVDSESVLKKIPPLFEIVLQLCFDIEKLGFSNDSKITNAEQACQNRSHLFSQLKDKTKSKASKAFSSFRRHVEAFFGKAKQIQGILNDRST